MTIVVIHLTRLKNFPPIIRNRPLSYPDTHIFVIVFDVTNKDSLESVTRKWVPEIKGTYLWPGAVKPLMNC